MQSAIVAAAYGLPAAYTLAYLVRTGRPGLRSRVRQAAGAALWPAYWLIVHGPATILARARAMVVQVGIGTERLVRRSIRSLWRWVRSLWRWTVALARILLRLIAAIARATWAACEGSVPYRYVRHYRSYRRGGLSWRYAVWYAWQVASLEPRRVPAG